MELRGRGTGWLTTSQSDLAQAQREGVLRQGRPGDGQLLAKHRPRSTEENVARGGVTPPICPSLLYSKRKSCDDRALKKTEQKEKVGQRKDKPTMGCQDTR